MQPIKSVTTTYGPFTDQYGSVYYKTVEGFRQARPYDRPLPFVLDVHERLFGPVDATSWGYGPPPYSSYPEPVDKAYRMARNAAYEKLVSRLGDSSSFGATLTAELRETWGMLTGTTLRILSAAKSIKRLRFANAAAELGIPYFERDRKVRVGWKHTRVLRRGRWRKERRGVYTTRTYMQFGTYKEIEKSLAGGWLMWSYGVKPLASDLYNAMDHWGREQPYGKRVSGQGQGEASYDLGQYGSIGTFSAKIGVICIARVSVNNAQLWNANKLGLVNPAQWILEAIPFSFIVDWFSNLSSVIMSFTDLVGLKIEDAVTCEKHWITETSVRDPNFPWPVTATGKKRFRFQRLPGLITPELVFTYERFSWQRGLNAISLLVGFKP